MTKIENTIIENAAGFLDCGIELTGGSSRIIRVFSEHYDPSVFEREEIISALKTFCLGHEKAELKLLAPLNTISIKKHTTLLDLAHRFSSKLKIRESADAIKELSGQFMVGDRHLVLHQPNADSQHGYFNPDYPARASQLLEAFDRVWQYAGENPEFRSVSI